MPKFDRRNHERKREFVFVIRVDMVPIVIGGGLSIIIAPDADWVSRSKRPFN
jgi:hypothetical protein